MVDNATMERVAKRNLEARDSETVALAVFVIALLERNERLEREVAELREALDAARLKDG